MHAEIPFDRLPPHDPQMEMGVLGCAMLSPATCLPQILAALKSKTAFYVLPHQIIFCALGEMHRAGTPIDLITVQQHLKDAGLLEQIGGIPYLSQLQDAVPSAANLSYYLDKVHEKFGLRKILQTCTSVQSRIMAGNVPIDDLKFSVQSDLGEVFGANTGNLSARLESRIYKATTQPAEPAPRFRLGGVPISTPANLTTMSAQAKAGKSAAVGAMIGCTFAAAGVDCLGFASENPNGYAVVHLDTEQCPFDHWSANQRTIRRAKVAAAPAWLRSYCVTGFTAADVRASIRLLTEQSAKKFGGVHSVFVDGLADSAQDVNDPGESSSIVTGLHALAIEFDCPIVSIIHVNPGSDFKTRGHLGSQLERKSETNLRLEKDDDGVTVIFADKNRRAPIPKNTGPRFAWSQDQQMHVLVPSLKSAMDDIERDTLKELANDIFSDRPSMRYADFQTTVKNRLTVSDKTAERKVSRCRQLGIVTKTVAGLYILSP